jgi:hypothetical protein
MSGNLACLSRGLKERLRRLEGLISRTIHPTESICSTTISRPVTTAKQGVISIPLPLAAVLCRMLDMDFGE